MQDGQKAVWSIPYVSVAFFPSLKQNFIAYHFSKVSDWIFEIHQLWQSDFCRVYSNSCCSCSFEREIIKIGQSSHKMYRNNSEFSRVYNNFKCPYEKSLETYCMHLLPLSWQVREALWSVNIPKWVKVDDRQGLCLSERECIWAATWTVKKVLIPQIEESSCWYQK